MCKLLFHDPYVKELQRLESHALKSATARRVLEQLGFIHSALANGNELDGQFTKRAEPRITHVLGLNLAGDFRMLIWSHGSINVPLYIGKADDVEQWIQQYKGAQFAIHVGKDGRDSSLDFRRLDGIGQSVDDMGRAADENPIPHESQTPLVELADHLFVDLGMTIAQVRALKSGLRCDLSLEMRRFVSRGVVNGDICKADHLLAAFEHARRGNLDAARMDLLVAAGRSITVDDDPDGFVKALAGVSLGAPITPADEHALAMVRKLISGGTVDDWMLHLMPSQRHIVDAVAGGPMRLLGVSGSGKTSVLLHRARVLAERYPGERILVVTLNESLARYLSHLLDKLCVSAGPRSRIEVKALVDVCGRIAGTRAGSNIRRRDPRSGEIPEDTWRDFSEKYSKKIQAILDAIAGDARGRGCEPAAYVREELVWIRSGWSVDDRRKYDVAKRNDRAIPFPTAAGEIPPLAQRGAFPVDTRPVLRGLLDEFEHYMDSGAVYDVDGISVLAHSVVRADRRPPEHHGYRCVLVDEMQDVSTLELEILNWLVQNPVDGLFLCGDLAQKVFPKHHDHGMAKISITGRAHRLDQNFRNTRQILVAAHALIEQFRSDVGAVVEKDGIIDPKYAVRQGDKPNLIECDSRAQQVRYVVEMVRKYHLNDLDQSATCVVSHDERTLKEVEAAFATLDQPIATLRLTPAAKFDKGRRAVRIAHLADVKGFEFKAVFVLDASDPHRIALEDSSDSSDSELYEGYPTIGVPWGERWRDAFKLYVAMSRARESLYVTYIYNRSPLLSGIRDEMTAAKAADCLSKPRTAGTPSTPKKRAAVHVPLKARSTLVGGLNKVRSVDQTTRTRNGATLIDPIVWCGRLNPGSNAGASMHRTKHALERQQQRAIGKQTQKLVQSYGQQFHYRRDERGQKQTFLIYWLSDQAILEHRSEIELEATPQDVRHARNIAMVTQDDRVITTYRVNKPKMVWKQC
jgi:superfamily I DNA/RNA helicase